MRYEKLLIYYIILNTLFGLGSFFSRDISLRDLQSDQILQFLLFSIFLFVYGVINNLLFTSYRGVSKKNKIILFAVSILIAFFIATIVVRYYG